MRYKRQFIWMNNEYSRYTLQVCILFFCFAGSFVRHKKKRNIWSSHLDTKKVSANSIKEWFTVHALNILAAIDCYHPTVISICSLQCIIPHTQTHINDFETCFIRLKNTEHYHIQFINHSRCTYTIFILIKMIAILFLIIRSESVCETSGWLLLCVCGARNWINSSLWITL